MRANQRQTRRNLKWFSHHFKISCWNLTSGSLCQSANIQQPKIKVYFSFKMCMNKKTNDLISSIPPFRCLDTFERSSALCVTFPTSLSPPFIYIYVAVMHKCVVKHTVRGPSFISVTTGCFLFFRFRFFNTPLSSLKSSRFPLKCPISTCFVLVIYFTLY